MAAASPAFADRYEASAVWTGTEMIIWGGTKVFAPEETGGAYDLKKDSWRSVSAPSFGGRKSHSAVWTGSEMIVWGGESSSGPEATGGRYNPTTNTWSVLPATSLAARSHHSAVWVPTTGEMIVWGGRDSSKDLADGAVFKVSTSTWSPLPAAPIGARNSHRAFWSGTEMIILGGEGTGARNGARFDPATRKWTTIPDAPSSVDTKGGGVVLGDGALFVWGGVSASGDPLAEGAKYVLSAGSWSTLPTPTTTVFDPPERASAAVFYGAGRLWAWGGSGNDASSKPVYPSTGGGFEVTAGAWSPMPTAGAPGGRTAPYVVWTGSSAIVWGGSAKPGSGSSLLEDGAVFTP
jgi:hypothetical protein